jgi:hypothetical protein
MVRASISSATQGLEATILKRNKSLQTFRHIFTNLWILSQYVYLFQRSLPSRCSGAFLHQGGAKPAVGIPHSIPTF